MNEPTLLEFFLEYLTWIDAGAPQESDSDEIVFSRAAGLCYNVVLFSDRYGSRRRLVTDLTAALSADFGHASFVFGSAKDYTERRINSSAYLLRPRIEWVRKKIEEIKANG